MRHWAQYPNWENALDEEGTEGQDELTLRPAEVQDHIGGDVVYTAGTVKCADGAVLRALFAIGYERDVVAVFGFVAENTAWCISYGVGGIRRWRADDDSWLPENERGPAVSFDDTKVFPIVIESQLPRERDGKPHRFEIRSDGEAQDLP